MVVNFKTHRINRDTHKLAQTPELIKKKTKNSRPLIIFCIAEGF
jgi:hypothetical protein